MNTTVRLATVDDYQAVVDIHNDVYYGFDYIQSQYHDIINDPDFVSYLCVVDEKVVGFRCGCLVDDDQSVMIRSGRVHKDYQGHRILQRILSEIKTHFSKNPRLKYELSSHNNAVQFRNSASFCETHKFLFDRTMTWFTCCTSVTVAKCVKSNTLTQLSVQEFCDSFSDKALMKYLFPYDRVVLNSWHLRLIPENFRHIQRQRPNIFRSDKLNNEGLLTIGLTTRVPLGLCFHIELFGRVDEKELEKHLSKQVQCLTEQGIHDEVLHIIIYSDTNVSLTLIQEACMGLELQKKQFPLTDLHFFEATLQKDSPN